MELYRGIDQFIKEYNQRKHQGIGRKKPINLYPNQRKNRLNQLNLVQEMGKNIVKQLEKLMKLSPHGLLYLIFSNFALWQIESKT